MKISPPFALQKKKIAALAGGVFIGLFLSLTAVRQAAMSNMVQQAASGNF